MVKACLSCTILAFALACYGECNRSPFRPSPQLTCSTVADQISNSMEAGAELNRRIGELNSSISQARQNIWRLFPNKPGYEAAEAEFASALANKDAYYLLISLPQGMTGDAARIMNVLNIAPGMTLDQYRNALHSDPKNVDGGINRLAYPIFARWVTALRRDGGAQTDGQFVSPTVLFKAISSPSNYRQAYEHARNWSELTSSGLELSKYLSPQIYARKIMETNVSMQMALVNKSGDIPNSEAAANDLYDELVTIFGEKAVVASAQAVLKAPKNVIGYLQTPAQIDAGQLQQSDSNDPFRNFISRIAAASPHNYAVTLFLNPYDLNAAIGTKQGWVAAIDLFNKYAAKFGEKNVLSAAERLRVAVKSSDGRIRGYPQEQLAGWLNKALEDPSTVIPSGHLTIYSTRQIAASQGVDYAVIRGVVSRVDIQRGHYMTLHLREAPDDSVVAYSANGEMFSRAYGDSFSQLIGKPVELEGDVNRLAPGKVGIRILETNQIRIVASAEIPSASAVDTPGSVVRPLPPSDTAPALRDRKIQASRIFTSFNGRYRCGASIDFQLRILPMPDQIGSIDPDAGLRGSMNINYKVSSTRRAFSSYSLAGSYDSKTGHFRLDPKEWNQPHPASLDMVGIEGTFDPVTSRISGRALNAGCDSVEFADLNKALPPLASDEASRQFVIASGASEKRPERRVQQTNVTNYLDPASFSPDFEYLVTASIQPNDPDVVRSGSAIDMEIEELKGEMLECGGSQKVAWNGLKGTAPGHVGTTARYVIECAGDCQGIAYRPYVGAKVLHFGLTEPLPTLQITSVNFGGTDFRWNFSRTRDSQPPPDVYVHQFVAFRGRSESVLSCKAPPSSAQLVTRAGDAPVSAPVASAKMSTAQTRELSDRYQLLARRANQARSALIRVQNQAVRGSGGGITVAARDARSTMDVQLQGAINAITAGDAAHAIECLRNAEDALSAIEEFLRR